MHVKNLFASRTAIRIAMFLSRHLSPAGIRRLSGVIAWWLVLVRGSIYHAIRQNQARVRGLPFNDPSLTSAVRAVLLHQGQVLYDLFRAAIDRPAPMHLDDASWHCLFDAYQSGRGVIVAGAHLSNFDLMMRHFGNRGIPIQLLSLTEPPAGFQMVNALRTGPMFDVTPVSPKALRTAIRRLRAGQVVTTGVDRPVPGQMEAVEFFGAQAQLPVGHIRLALQTNALVLLAWCEWDASDGYHTHIIGPIEMLRSGDTQHDVALNARRVLALLEPAIARHPDQWLMFVPVWPLHELP